jgi:hypothetical protein
VSPNNPTGSFTKAHEFERLASLGLPLVVDEVFAEFPLDIESPARTPALSVKAPLVFALDGLSKRALLPQLKLAWITVSGNAELVAQAVDRLEIVADMFLSPNTPVQHALPELLNHTEALRGVVAARLRRNLDTLKRLLRGGPATPLRVEGGWSAIVRLPNVVEDWATTLLETEQLVVQPGWLYDLAEAHVVVSLLTESARFEEGVARLMRSVTSQI